MELGFVEWLSNVLGSPEPAIRLIISLVLGYPVAFIHRRFLYGKSPTLQHIYFIGCGMGFCYFNYGTDTIHSFASIGITYLILKIIGGSTLSLLLVFIYTMVHLLVGYWTTATSTYDIKWTMPQCVLTLRLIALAFNVNDGQQKEEYLSEENKNAALPSMPSVLEVYAYCYFPGTFLVGPQLPIRRYLDFVYLKLEKKDDPYELPNSVTPGLKRMGLGFLYLCVYQVGYSYIYDDYFTTEEYKYLPMWKQWFFLGLWSRFTLYKYISCWLLTEGSCIIMGLTYNGMDEKGEAKWDGCSNVKLNVFESAIKLHNYIESFNTNTNQWVAQYLYKRLKFLNNKMLSHMGALLFLAIWHGFHSGYYATFLFEFLSITAERDVQNILQRNEKFNQIMRQQTVGIVINVFLRIYAFIAMGYAMVPFILLKHERYIPVFKELYFAGHIACIAVLAFGPMLKGRKPRERSESNQSSQSSHRSRIQVKVKGN